MRVWVFLFAVGFLISPAFSEPTTDLAQHDAETKLIVLQNPYLQVFLSYDNQIHLQSITYSNQPFLRVPDGASFPTGSRLKLYKKHPKESREEYALPNKYTAQVVSDGEKSKIDIQGQDGPVFQIQSSYLFKQNESTLYIESKITNQSDETIEFYPSEENVYSTEFGVSGMLNPYFRLYAPVSDEISSVTDMKFLSGSPGDKQFKLDKDKGIFELKHERRGAEFMFTRDENWLAAATVRDIVKKTGMVCSVDYKFNKPLENVKDNVIVLLSNFSKDNKISTDKQGVLRGIKPLSTHVTYVHGKVRLAAGESISYKQTWGLGSSILPITTVENGIAYFRRLEAYKVENGFALFSISTNPAKGTAAFQCVGDDGLPFRTDTVVVLNPLNPGMGTTEVEANLPLVVSSNYNFGIVLPATAPQIAELRGFATQETPSITKSLRFVILDPETDEPIRIIDEVEGPWKDYAPGVIK
ncbi:MAG: hypothetical protein P9L94_17890 [Candidatus Hinthialibacter antarcticus]|nr:hypothetical protein [Candidatus Hinthialibacter antarcticus]